MLFVTYSTEKNTKRSDKPNEDFIICDSQNHVFILLDGVSRDVKEGVYPNPSPSEEVARLLGTEIHRQICLDLDTSNDVSGRIRYSVLKANELVAEYNHKYKLVFQAGAVGIIIIIKDNVMYYCYIGDCCGRIIRNGEMITFTKMQTALISEHKKNYSANEIRNVICNNPKHPFAYGVLNGDPCAEYFMRFGTCQLYRKDQILISSDGMEPFLSKASIATMQLNSAKELLEKSILANNVNQDDKSIIKIQI